MKEKKKEEAKPENEAASEGSPQDEDEAGPVDLKKVRQTIKHKVSSGAVTLVENILKKDGKLSYLAMKYLFEIAGLYPASAAEEAEQEDSLAKILLRHLGLEDESKTGSEGTKDTQANGAGEQRMP
jgi:hypothetical protein